MKILVVKDYHDMSRLAAEKIADVVNSIQYPVLGLATGSTPVGTYRILADECDKKRITFKRTCTVNLDEYVGLGRRDSQSYVCYMHEYFFDRIDISERNTNLPNGLAKNLEKECQRYHDFLATHQQDIQLLGLGSNGHIGFNEPFTHFDSVTHVVDLTPSTIKDNSRFFASIDEVPTQAITMGISEIMNAKQILVLASGREKANAVFDMVYGQVTESCPASILQTHRNCVLIADMDAAEKIMDVK